LISSIPIENFEPSIILLYLLYIVYLVLRVFKAFGQYIFMPKFLGSGKVTRSDQITIPKEARKRFTIEKGDFLLFYEEDGKLIIKKG
jgi:AbrB family looped-hinge helix DNA binding protein